MADRSLSEEMRGPERWTIFVCDDCGEQAHAPGARCDADRRRTWTRMREVDVVRASRVEALEGQLDRAVQALEAFPRFFDEAMSPEHVRTEAEYNADIQRAVSRCSVEIHRALADLGVDRKGEQ